MPRQKRKPRLLRNRLERLQRRQPLSLSRLRLDRPNKYEHEDENEAEDDSIMSDTLDQLFVNLKAWLVGFAPLEWQSLLSAIISVAALLAVFPGLFAITTILERKGLG